MTVQQPAFAGKVLKPERWDKNMNTSPIASMGLFQCAPYGDEERSVFFMTEVIPKEKLRKMVRAEQRKYEESDGMYKRQRIPLGFYAIGETGDEIGIAEIVIEQAELVKKIMEE